MCIPVTKPAANTTDKGATARGLTAAGQTHFAAAVACSVPQPSGQPARSARAVAHRAVAAALPVDRGWMESVSVSEAVSEAHQPGAGLEQQQQQARQRSSRDTRGGNLLTDTVAALLTSSAFTIITYPLHRIKILLQVRLGAWERGPRKGRQTCVCAAWQRVDGGGGRAGLLRHSAPLMCCLYVCNYGHYFFPAGPHGTCGCRRRLRAYRHRTRTPSSSQVRCPRPPPSPPGRRHVVWRCPCVACGHFHSTAACSLRGMPSRSPSRFLPA